jgi:ER membrane protein complex subunit 1
MKDMSIHFFNSQYERMWKRNEALSSIKSFKFLDISESKEAKSDILHYMKHLESMDGSLTKIPAKILTRYAYHAKKLITFLSNLPTYISEKLHPHQEDVFERDEFGFKKIIIGITEDQNTLLGLQSNNGNLLWTLHLSKLISENNLFVNKDDEIVFSDFHLIEKEDEDNEAVVILSGKQNSLFIVFDPYNGIIISSKLYKDRQIRNTFKIHLASLIEVVTLVDTEKRIIFYPFDVTEQVTKDHPVCHKKTGPELKLCQEELKSLLTIMSFYEFHESEKGIEIKGETFDNKVCKGIHEDQSCLSASWKIPLHGQKLVAYSSKHIPERSHFHSQKVTNLNGAILFKYLEPTLFAMATTSVEENNDNSISVFIIDGVTGRIVHQFIEKNIMLDKPVNLLIDENMLIFTFLRRGKFGEGVQEIHTLNMYEQNVRYHARDVILDYLKGKNTTNLYGEMPIIIQQAYIFPQVIKSMGITRTQQGITGKDYLLILENNQVYALKQLLVSPRRPKSEIMDDNLDMDMTGDLQDRDLIPYDAHLPYDPTSIISHRHELIDMRRVETAPSRIESTSLTITYGSDIFYSHVAPEKQFDLLSEDFNKNYLMLTIVALVLISCLYPKSKKKKY